MKKDGDVVKNLRSMKRYGDPDKIENYQGLPNTTEDLREKREPLTDFEKFSIKQKK
ncbi:hypothetical protein ACFL23_02435 [Patescibacteria group bacterium]